MLNTRTVHGLKLIAYVAADPHYLPVTVAKLSRQLGLSVSYTERLVREPNDQGLLSAHRGPGGGYMLQICVDELSVWDVAAFYIYKGIATIAKIYNVSFLLSKSLLVMFIGFFVLTSAQAEISEENALAIKKQYKVS